MSRDTKVETFSTRLRHLREQAGLSVAILAERVKMGRTALHRLEAGDRQPSLATARKLAMALRVSLAVFDKVV